MAWLHVDFDDDSLRSTSSHAAPTRRREDLIHLPGPPGHPPAVAPAGNDQGQASAELNWVARARAPTPQSRSERAAAA